MQKKSVIITHYRNVKFLYEAVESVMKQTVSLDYRYIFCDGGADKIDRDLFKGWIIYESAENLGQFGLFNAYKNKVEGDRIFILDSDDLWLSNHVQTHMKYDHDIVATSNKIMREGRIGRRGGIFAYALKRNNNTLLRRNWIGPISQVSFNASLWKSGLPIPCELETNKDWYFYISLTNKHLVSIKKVNRVTILYRVWSGGVSSNLEKIQRGRKLFWELTRDSRFISESDYFEFYRLCLTRGLLKEIAWAEVKNNTRKYHQLILKVLMCLRRK